MITRIEVDGFKSLKEFHLNFAHGLNILVGPNGSGKTNIVSFFEFVAHLMETDASDAISSVGGAGAVFRRLGLTYERKITARISGCTAVENSGRRSVEDKAKALPFCAYDYSFTLIFPEAGDTVLFERQRLRLRRVRSFVDVAALEDSARWGLDIEAECAKDGTTQVKTNSFDDALLELPYYPVRASKAGPGKKGPSVEQILSEILGGGNISLLPSVARYSPDLWPITRDLTGGQIYNIVPSKLKVAEDGAKPPGISRDGSGLAATLYALQRSRYPLEFNHWALFHRPPRGRYDPSGLDQLKAYLNLVNESVRDISVENDPFENQLRVRFVIKSGGYEATLPMGLMSDGTLKWLAVVTAAVTASSVFCIEEPENYLHPQMQGQLVTILREILFRGETHRFTLMTTHSETLLNHCRPEELIIVSMQDGRTEARRCSNAADISDEISRTGFGLGYYFVSNAVEND